MALLLAAGAEFTWRLGASAYANAYYSAAALAGSESWKAMLFGSLDPANAITVDKPPLGLWPMVLSVRAFGLSSWSILLPQAGEGVACVWLLYLCVRRVTGVAWPALLAGVVFALTPVVVLVFRYNNPDALLTLLVLAAGYATLRAVHSDARAGGWLALAGVLCGLGFLTKMLEAFLVLPALALTYAVLGAPPLARRLRHLATAGVCVVLGSGWWIAVVELWPATSRPFVGGSQTNSVLELALGYNGLGRLTGSAGTSAGTTGLGATNLARIGRTDLGGEMLWLLPAAVVLGLLAWRLSGPAAPGRRTDRMVRAGLLLWGSWLAVAGATFAVMVGIFHSYYTVILTPAIASLVAIGVWQAWEHRHLDGVRTTLSASTAATGLVASATLLVLGDHLRWTALPVLVACLLAAVVLTPVRGAPRLTWVIGVAALVPVLAGPAVFSAATVLLPHAGSGPMAGPGRGASDSLLLAGRVASSGETASAYGAVSPGLFGLLVARAESYRWTAAAFGAQSAAAFELALEEPVLAIGGYKGTDPAPTLAQFQTMVHTGQVHWLVTGGTAGSSAAAIETWTAAQYPAFRADGRTLFDLSASPR